jgi:hypothetical protein
MCLFLSRAGSAFQERFQGDSSNDLLGLLEGGRAQGGGCTR